MAIEEVPDIPMFRKNTAAFVHDLPADGPRERGRRHHYVRVQVLTNAGALDRDKQLAVVSQLTDLVAEAAGDPACATHVGAADRGARAAGAWATPTPTRSSSPPPGRSSHRASSGAPGSARGRHWSGWGSSQLTFGFAPM